MPRQPPDPEKVARALHLRRANPDWSLARIAEEIGVNSHATVRNYLAIAEQSERWFPALDRREMGAKVDLVLSELADRLLRRLDEDDAQPEKVSPALVQVLQEISKRHGLYAPTRTVVEVDGDQTPDARTTAAIRAALDRYANQESGDDDGPDDGT